MGWEVALDLREIFGTREEKKLGAVRVGGYVPSFLLLLDSLFFHLEIFLDLVISLLFSAFRKGKELMSFG